MPEQVWTPSLVEERLCEAAEVLRRLPDVRVQGYFSTWPPTVRDYWESYGRSAARVRLGPPSPASIDRMDHALEWLRWLEYDDMRIVWLRASGERWKKICWDVGMHRSAAHQHWRYALSVIAWKLNGRTVPKHRARERFIARVRDARP